MSRGLITEVRIHMFYKRFVVHQLFKNSRKLSVFILGNIVIFLYLIGIYISERALVLPIVHLYCILSLWDSLPTTRLLVLFQEFTEAIEGLWTKLELKPLNGPYIVELSFAPIEKDFYVLVFIYTHDFIMGMHLFSRKPAWLLKPFKRDTVGKEDIMGLLS